MKSCHRCGIDIDHGEICYDCADVEGIERTVETRYVEPYRRMSKLTGYKVGSSRKGGHIPKAARETMRQRTIELTKAGCSANQVAIAIGVSTRTVTRWRTELNTEWTRLPNQMYRR